MRISDWSSDVCSSDLIGSVQRKAINGDHILPTDKGDFAAAVLKRRRIFVAQIDRDRVAVKTPCYGGLRTDQKAVGRSHSLLFPQANAIIRHRAARSEEHTSELQSLMRISYAVFCLKKKTSNNDI